MKQEDFESELMKIRNKHLNTGRPGSDLHKYYDVPKGVYQVILREDLFKLLSVTWTLGMISQKLYGGTPSVPNEMSESYEYICYLVEKTLKGLENETRGD